MPVQLNLREIREEAKGLLRTARVSPFRFTLLYLAISLGLSLLDTAITARFDVGGIDVLPFSISFVSILITLFTTVLHAGFVCYCLCVYRGEETPCDALFDAFPFAGKVILLEVLEALVIGVGIMLFIVPGVILLFSYAFSMIHLCEDPEIGAIEALRRSRREMLGYKWQLFRLFLGFWPMLLLSAVVTYACSRLLSGLLPDTLVGALLSTLISGVLSGAVDVWLMPWIALAEVGFFRRVTAPQSQNNEPF